MLTAISAIFIFLVVVLIHELGHFAVAKAVGVRVNEFSIGMGPLIKKWEKGETKYSLRLLPIGGYVAMEGEDEDSNDPRGFGNAKTWKKLAIVVAGAVMNFILAIVVFTIVALGVGTPTTEIEEILESSPAEKAELKSGDIVVSINNNSIEEWNDITKYIGESEPEEEIDLIISRDGEEKELKLLPIEEDGRTIIGIIPKNKKSFLSSIKMGFSQTKLVLVSMFGFIKSLFRGEIEKGSISGPVGVISIIGDATKLGIFNVLNFLGLISVNLGFFNLLPIPALDGGRILFLLIELVRGKPLDPDKEGVIHLIGFVLLITLMLVVTYKDIVKLFF